MPSQGYANWQDNLNYMFNRKAMKLLSVIQGGKVDEYKQFAEQTQPFVQGSSGYFKMSLYPLVFKNIPCYQWTKTFAPATGFINKAHFWVLTASR